VPDRRQVRALFDWLAPRYDAAVVGYSLGQDLRWKSELIRRIAPKAGERALDLATGTGLLYDRLARHLGPDRVVGLDVNWTMLRAARVGLGPRRTVRADSIRLPFRDGTFDVVTAGYLFKYVPLDALAREIRRVLRPGGRVGGYDFSSPRADRIDGAAYGVFLHRVLPQLGRWRDRGDPNWQGLFDFLDWVARGSRWEARIEGEFARAGLVAIERVPSLGGAITWVWAKAPAAPGRAERSPSTVPVGVAPARDARPAGPIRRHPPGLASRRDRWRSYPDTT
jgi:demethylmenaquinone methyltransferase/2-methoxy-6-polyprenyl-1,4-benzoquinol methylase